MSYLLDTHTFLWFINDDLILSSFAKSLIEQPDNDIHLSMASLWEMAIKISLGRLEMPSPFIGFINQQLFENNIRLLDIKAEHIGLIATLPFYHRDPFDRLIIAQAQIENLPIIGKDGIFDKYGVKRHWES